MSLIAIWLITSALFLLGTIGVFVPALPGIGLVYIGVLFYAIATQFSTISLTAVVVFGIISLIASLADYLGSLAGAKIGGGKIKSVIGTSIGAILGLLIGGPVTFFIGAFLGALVGAFAEGKDKKEAVKIAAVSVVGIVGGTILQFIFAITLIIAFLINVAT